MAVRPEVKPFLIGASLVFFAPGLALIFVHNTDKLALALFLAGGLVCEIFVFFFRDPDRKVIADSSSVLSGADGVVSQIAEVEEGRYLKTRAIRISVFLNLFDVHVNRTPIPGAVVSAEYYPGKHVFAFLDKASDDNQHSAILIQGEKTKCLVKQIVGPVARRVVFWIKPGQILAPGERIGMMKFGSRLDVFLPKSDVVVTVKKGDRVRAGETVLASIKNESIKIEERTHESRYRN